MVIVYIHGASATSESFTHIREHIKHQDLVIDYSSSDGFSFNLSSMIKQIENIDKIFFIAHSLGGIYALHLANYFSDKVVGAVTLSTPYGGSKAADYAKYFLPFSRLMRDIGPNSEPMRLIRSMPVPPNWTNLVTVAGDSPWMHEPNDGVVTHSSMRALPGMDLVELELNHYEIVISNKTIDAIQQCLGKFNQQ
jgi:pimeloyl-ACP methyl ester carboxylesterase